MSIVSDSSSGSTSDGTPNLLDAILPLATAPPVGVPTHNHPSSQASVSTTTESSCSFQTAEENLYQREIRCANKCAHTEVLQEPKNSPLFFHSILIPCSLKNPWAIFNNFFGADDKQRVDIAKRLSNTYLMSECKCSLLSRLSEDLLDPNFPMPVSDYMFQKVLSTTFVFDKANVCDTYGKTKIDLHLHLMALRRISYEMEDSKGTPGLVVYQKIVSILSKLSFNHSSFLQNAISCRSGPVTDLAASVTVENINYWLGTLKIASTTEQVDKVFRDPSVTGKCCAILKLLEIHDLLWKPVDMSIAHTLVSILYKLFSFMMKQFDLAKQYAKQGYEWVSAKFQRRGKENELFSGVDPELPETEEYYDALEHQALEKNALPPASFVPSEAYTDIVVVPRYLADAAKPAASSVGDLDIDSESVVYCDKHVLDVRLVEMIDRMKAGTLSRSDMSELSHSSFTDSSDSVNSTIFNLLSKYANVHDWDVSADEESTCMYGMEQPVPAAASLDTLPLGIEHHTFNLEEIRKALATTVKPEDIGSRVISDKDYHSIITNAQQGSPTPPSSDTMTQEDVRGVFDLIRDLEFSKLGEKFLDWMKTMFADVYRFFLEHPITGAAMGVVYTVLSFMGFTVSEFSNANANKSFFQKVSNSMKDMYYASRGKDVIVNTFANFSEIAAEMLNISADPTLDAFKIELERLSTLSNALLIEATASPGRFVNNASRFVEFKNTMDLIEKQYATLIKINPKANVRNIQPIWLKLHTSYQKLHQIWCKYLASGGLRQEPVCVWLYGPTNIGKSHFSQFLMDSINKLNGTQWATYNISKGPAYWNGFQQQDIICIDDFGAYVGPEGCQDALAVMNLCTSSAFNPNMAVLEEKCIQATPKLFIICSNHPTAPYNSGISDLVAFERRRDVFVKVTYPEHEGCGATQDNCDHFKDKEINDYSHLKFELQSPIVSEAFTPNKQSQHKRVPDHKIAFKPISGGPKIYGSVTPQQIMEIVNRKVKEKKNKFNTALLRREHAMGVGHQAIGDITIDNWAIRPNFMLVGPPGTGKTKILCKVKAELRVTTDPNWKAVSTFYVDSLEKFENFCKDGYKGLPGTRYVIFDDVSSWCDSDFFEEWMNTLKQRYDSVSSTIPWVFGCNETIMKEALRKKKNEAAGEFWDMIERRCERVNCSFKKLTGFMGLCGRYNNAASVRAYTVEGNIDDVVSYKSRDGTVYSNISLIKLLKNFHPEQEEESIPTRLPTISEYYPSASVVLKMTSNEFLNEYMNSNCDIMKAVNLMMGNEVEYRSLPNVPTKIKMMSKIMASYNSCKSIRGAKFTSMYDFVMEGWINKYFDNFKDINVLMCFTDQAYYIRTLSGVIEAGIYEPPDMAGYKVAQASKLVKQELDALEAAEIITSNLPPWFCLAVQCVAQVAKIGLTLAAATYSVQQNTTLFRAQEAERVVNERKEQYLDDEQAAIGDRFSAALQTKAYPKDVGHKGTMQHTIDEKPRIPIASVQENTPSQKPSTEKKQRKRMRAFKVQGIPHYDIPPEFSEQDLIENMRHESVNADLQGQFTEDPQLAVILSTIKNNVVQVVRVEDDMRLCYGLMIAGKLGTTVGHVFKTYKPSELKMVTTTGEKYSFVVTNTDANWDSCDFKITDPKCPSFKNIVNHITSKDFAVHGKKSCILFSVNCDHFGKWPTVILRVYDLEEMSVYEVEGATHHGYSYTGTRTGYKLSNIGTVQGDCGSILLVSDSAWSAKVIGMHTASDGKVAYSRPLFKEDFSNASLYQSVPYVPKPNQFGLFGRFGEFVVPFTSTDKEGRELLGVAKMLQFTPATTKLWKSPIPYGPKEYEPSLLSQHDTRNPDAAFDFMADETFKWCKERKSLSEEDCRLLDVCFRDIGDHMAQVIKRNGCPISVLSKTGALNKLPGAEHSQPIQLASSAGYPFNARTQKGKRAYIEVCDDGIRRFTKSRDGQDLINSVDDLIDDARNMQESFAVFKVCLKDELVKLKKIYTTPKTRTIAAAPLHLVIALRMYFHSCYAAIAQCWPELAPKVGIDAASFDWHLFTTWMLQKSDVGFDFDYKAWDFCVPPEYTERLWVVYDSIHKMCNKNYTQEDQTILRWLLYNVHQFKFLFMRRIYRATGGMASGAPGTSTDNSIFGMVNIYFAFIKLCIANGFTWSYAIFLEMIRMADYGDDVLVAVVKWILEWFNGLTVAEELSKIGWDVTSANKDVPLVPFKKISDCEFMSRGFSQLCGYWVGPLRIPQIVKCTHYVTTPKSHFFWKDQDVEYFEPSLFSEISECALKEMFLHGEEEYNKFRQHFIDGFCSLGIETYVPTYGSQWNNFFGLVPIIQQQKVGYPINLHQIGFNVPIFDFEQYNWKEFRNRKCMSFGADYHFTGSRQRANRVPLEMQTFLDDVNSFYGKNYNSILVNKYQPGDEIPFHKDNEEGLVKDQGVTCVTYFGDGDLVIKGDQYSTYHLGAGDVYHLEGKVLTECVHGRFNHTAETISMTFRRIEMPSH